MTKRCSDSLDLTLILLNGERQKICVEKTATGLQIRHSIEELVKRTDEFYIRIMLKNGIRLHDEMVAEDLPCADLIVVKVKQVKVTSCGPVLDDGAYGAIYHDKGLDIAYLAPEDGSRVLKCNYTTEEFVIIGPTLNGTSKYEVEGIRGQSESIYFAPLCAAQTLRIDITNDTVEQLGPQFTEADLYKTEGFKLSNGVRGNLNHTLVILTVAEGPLEFRNGSMTTMASSAL